MPRDRRNAIHQAGARLAEYTDRLWTGGETASACLSDVYADRLASAAKMATMIQTRQPLDALIALIQRENHAFPRDLLATDTGREARSAFDALGRAIRTLEDFTLPSGHVPSGPEVIGGEQISAVMWARRYLQRSFDGPGFAVLCPAQIKPAHQLGPYGENGCVRFAGNRTS